MSDQKTIPRRKEARPDKPGRYRIDHPDTPMSLDVRAWQMWAVHPSDLDAIGFKTREAFFLAHLKTANERLREALKNVLPHAWGAEYHDDWIGNGVRREACIAAEKILEVKP